MYHEDWKMRLLPLAFTRAKKMGFTLLEMLVAMVILSTIITTVYSAFHAGIQASRRILREDNSVQNILGRLNLMASEIRNAVYQNNMLLVGNASEIYFYVPMELKKPSDILPLYRVRYWLERTGDQIGTLHRSVVSWIELQKPGLGPEEIARLEADQAWLGPLDQFQIQFALSKRRSSITIIGDEGQPEEEGTPVDGNSELRWRTQFDPGSQIPYGVQMSWLEKDGKKFSVLFWPALGLFQTKPSLLNVAPVSGVVVPANKDTAR